MIPGIGLAVGAGMALYDGVQGWGKAGERFGVSQDKATLGQKTSSTLGSILTLGLSEDAATSVAKFIHGVGSTLGKVVSGIGDCIANAVLGFIGFVCGDPELTKKWENLKQSISEGWSGLTKGIENIIDNFVNWWNEPPSLIDMISNSFKALVEKPKEIWNSFTSGIDEMFKNFSKSMDEAWNNLGEWFGSGWDSIKDMLPNWLKRLLFETGFPGKLTGSAPKSAKNSIENSNKSSSSNSNVNDTKNSTVYNPSKATVNNEGKAVGGFGSSIGNLISSAASSVGGVLSSAYNSASSVVSNIGNSVSGAVSSAGSALVDAGILPASLLSGNLSNSKMSSQQLNSVVDYVNKGTGLSPDTIRKFIQIESNGNPSAGTGEYIGLFQMGKQAMADSGMQYDRNKLKDPMYNAQAFVSYYKKVVPTLQKNNIPVTATTLYLLHQQGQGGLNAIWQLASKGNLDANISTNYDLALNMSKNPYNGGKPRYMSAWEFIQGWASRFGEKLPIPDNVGMYARAVVTPETWREINTNKGKKITPQMSNTVRYAASSNSNIILSAPKINGEIPTISTNNQSFKPTNSNNNDSGVSGFFSNIASKGQEFANNTVNNVSNSGFGQAIKGVVNKAKDVGTYIANGGSVPMMLASLKRKADSVVRKWGRPVRDNIELNHFLAMDKKNNGVPFKGYGYSGVGRGIKIEKMHPKFLNQFLAMAKEYKDKTGKDIQITDGYRDYASQIEVYDKKGPRLAAYPGNSNHGYGLAMDIDTGTANYLAKSGLLDKYGFHRPYLASKGETWHIELKSLNAALAMQQDPSFFKGSSNEKVAFVQTPASTNVPIKTANNKGYSGIKDSPSKNINSGGGVLASVPKNVSNNLASGNGYSSLSPVANNIPSSNSITPSINNDSSNYMSINPTTASTLASNSYSNPNSTNNEQTITLSNSNRDVVNSINNLIPHLKEISNRIAGIQPSVNINQNNIDAKSGSSKNSYSKNSTPINSNGFSRDFIEAAKA
jgi:hypothetical protein